MLHVHTSKLEFIYTLIYIYIHTHICVCNIHLCRLLVLHFIYLTNTMKYRSHNRHCLRDFVHPSTVCINWPKDHFSVDLWWLICLLPFPYLLHRWHPRRCLWCFYPAGGVLQRSQPDRKAWHLWWFDDETRPCFSWKICRKGFGYRFCWFLWRMESDGTRFVFVFFTKQGKASQLM